MSIKNYGLVTSAEELKTFADKLIHDGIPFGFDIETGYLGADREKGSLHPETAIVAGISFTNSTDWARYVPLNHDTGENIDNVAAAVQLWEMLNTGLGVAHNAAFELRHLARFFRQHLTDHPLYGEAIAASHGYFPIRSDTQVEAYLMAEYQYFGLKPMTKAMFGHVMTELHELFEDLPKNKRKFLRFNTLELTPRVVEYACEDSVWCLAIHQKYFPEVKDRLLFRVEKAIVQDVIPEMEDYGVRYDWNFLRRNADILRSFRDRYNAEIMNELSEMTGAPVAINLASPPQIGDMLFNKLGMRTSVYTATTRDLPPSERKMSTGSIALAGLAKQHPVVKKILQWKEQTRLLGTYLDKYEGLYAYADDGHTHPNHMSAIVVTGRFAVSDPPYQQSPKKYHYDLSPARQAHAAHAEAHGSKCKCDEYPPPPGTCFSFNFRDAIVAPPDHYILGFDLSQAELRAIAGEARETALLEAFARGEDVHTLTASLMLGVPVAEVTDEQRSIGKTMNFALLYGMGVKSLADRLAIPVEEAQILMDKYFAGYPNIAAWGQRQIAHGKRYGYVTSKFGRRLPIWEYQSDKRWIYQKGDRACVNYPIQGAATGDYMKIAMVRARGAIRAAGLQDKIRLVMNIHDALEFYVHRSVLPQDVIAILKPAVVFEVPGWPAMKADWHLAKKWGTPMEIEVKDDGGLIVKGSVTYELAPAVEIDEDTGEEVPVMPDVDVDVLRAAAAKVAGATSEVAPEGSSEARRVLMQLSDMPTAEGWARFRSLVMSMPGADMLTVSTPEGDIDVPFGTNLGPQHVGQVSVILGPTKIKYAAGENVDITAGLSL